MQILSTLNALVLLAALLTVSVTIIAQYKKTTREAYEASKREWQDIFTRQKAHSDIFKTEVDDLNARILRHEKTIIDLKAAVTALESERSGWSKRNLYLYDLCQTFRQKLATFGVATQEVNGDVA